MVSDASIPKTFKKDPYRLLIVADMFQTGFDEPLLHTMYVDKMLYDIKAVQTLSRLNRACPKKYDTFVLDFANKTSIIEEAFSRYYRTTILSGETDPNKLYDIIALMEGYQVYSAEHVEKLVDLYLSGAERDRIDPILTLALRFIRNSKQTIRSSSRALQNPLCVHMDSLEPFCHTAMPIGRSCHLLESADSEAARAARRRSFTGYS